MRFDSAKFNNAAGHYRAAVKNISANIFDGNYHLVNVQIREANNEIMRMESAVESGADDPDVVACLSKLFKCRRELQQFQYIYEAQLVAEARKEEEEKAVELTGYAAKIRQFAK